MGDNSQTSRTKSRTGCSTCKKRRIKCDETKPACKQCQLKELCCPGYAAELRWSSKHEKFRVPKTRSSKSSSNNKRPNQVASSAPENLFQGGVANRSSSIDVICTNDLPESIETSSPRDGQVIAADDIWKSENVLHDSLLDDDEEMRTAMLSSAETNDCFTVTDSQEIESFGRRKTRSLPVNVLCSNPALRIDCYSNIVCRSLFAYDSSLNPFRTAVLARCDTSVLSYALAKYLIVAYLVAGTTNSEEDLLYRQAQSEIVFHLQQRTLASSNLLATNQQQFNELLFSTIMYGCSASWDGSSDLGIQHYNNAASLYTCCRNFHANTRKFFWQALVYWWCSLSWVSNAQYDSLRDPPILGEEDPYMRRLRDGKIIPHPLTGIAPQIFLLMGQVGTLVYALRMRVFSRPFISKTDIRYQENAIIKAEELEAKLLAFNYPLPVQLVADNETSTPTTDLVRTTQAYQQATLLTLYRNFPDLLSRRLQLPSEYPEDDENTILSRQQALASWRRLSAFQILELLSQNTPNSGSECLEQILLVIVSAEMYDTEQFVESDCNGLPLCDADLHGYQQLDALNRFGSHALVPASALFTPNPEDFIQNNGARHEEDAFPFHRLSSLEPFQDDYSFGTTIDLSLIQPTVQVPESTAASRDKILLRLANIRKRLPYQSVLVVEKLIREMWTRFDNGLDCFWMDIIIEKGWRTMMA